MGEARVMSRRNFFQKMNGHQKWKHPNRNKNFFKRNNKFTYQYANKSLFVQCFKPLFLAVSPAIVMRLVRN